MNFTQLLQDKITSASQTIGAVNTFCEYVSSKFTDLANFMSGLGQYASVYVAQNGDNTIQRLCRITNQDYDAACEDPTANLTLSITDNLSRDVNDTVTVTGQSVLDALDNQLGELKCQEQFMKYCLEAESISSTDFMTRVRTLSPNLPGYIIEKFSTFTVTGSSPIQCLRNFFSQFHVGAVSNQDQYITLVDPDDYVGNVWASAFTIVTDTIASFFAGVWKGIEDLNGFFQRLWNGLVKLGKYIINKAFHSLATVYEKASSAAMGVMDIPLVQLYGNLAQWANAVDRIDGLTTYSWDHYNHKFSWYDVTEYFRKGINSLTHDTIDGRTYRRIVEVVVPSDPCDIAIRFGWQDGQGSNLVLSIHVVTDYGSWDQYDDVTNNQRAYDSLMNGLRFISSVIPLVTTKQNVDDTSIMWHDITDICIDYNNLDDHELVSCLKMVPMVVNSQYILYNNQRMALVVVLLSYLQLMSRGFYYDDVDHTNDVLELLYGIDSTYPLTQEEMQFINFLDGSPIDLNVINKDTYRPYCKGNILPVTVHYQTTVEQAKEIINTILVAALAIVAIVVTVKYVKWSRNFKKQRLIAQGNLDRLSWDVAANPTAENMESFNKAWKKAHRMDFVAGIMGLSTGSGTDNVSTALGNVINMLGKNTNSSNSANSTATNINSKVGSVEGDVRAIKNLIK